jgi:hypothetical protein
MHKKSRRVNKRQKRQKCRSRKGGRRLRMRMRMKGGLGPNDSTNIGLQGTYSFANPAHQQLLKMFTFGSQSQHDLWLHLLTVCKQRPIPVYILTSGNRIGIIRTLQLMGWADAFVEVLCTHYDPSVNPDNVSGQHNFRGKTKYEVIQQILSEHGLSCAGPPPIGYLLDDSGFFTAQRLVRRLKIDITTATALIVALQTQGIIDRFGVVAEAADENAVKQAIARTPYGAHADKIYNIIARVRNSDFLKLCPAIQFVDVLTHSVAAPPTSPDFNLPALKANPIYQINVNHLGLPAIDGPGADFNFTPQIILQHVIQLVLSGSVKILFIDFDKTFQIWEGAIQFEHPSMLEMFKKNEMPIGIQ